MKRYYFSVLCLLCSLSLRSQDTVSTWLLVPDRVFDGVYIHEHWQVLVEHGAIAAVGPDLKSSGATRIDLSGATLCPGFIEGHSHLFLHPYNEVPWNDQVLKESRAERTARATVHAKSTLMAGFTTVRDLGTEGAMYDDVGLKEAVKKGVVPGPRMIVAGRAIVATGSYGPREFSAEIETPRGAAEADGVEGLTKEIRSQIGSGVDVIKIYADYRWGLNKTAAPTFTIAELTVAVEVANSAGRQVVVHAGTAEGMRRAIAAGVNTIEHGDEGTEAIFKLMKEKGIALCATLAAGDAIAQYRGWNKKTTAEPPAITAKRLSFQAALKAGVTICAGGDVGVFAHGDNARELEMMVSYGMKPLDVLRSATSVNATVFGLSTVTGSIRKGLAADIIAVAGNPAANIAAVRNIRLVMKEGVIYRNETR